MQTDGANVSSVSHGGLEGLTERPGTIGQKMEQAGRLAGYSTGARYRMRGEFLFAGIPLEGTRVLDVGCGAGAWSMWAALHGARHVVGIEPGADGSREGTFDVFQRSIAALGFERQVEARPHFLHELPKPDAPYDVVVMYNVINHLDEEAVVMLHRDGAARERYVTLLKDLVSWMRPGGWLIIADCGRTNAWLRFGMASPFVPTIEWHKHQDPGTWMEVCCQAGFRTVDLRWSPLQPFPKLTANWLVQYLTCAHFVLRFQTI